MKRYLNILLLLLVVLPGMARMTMPIMRFEGAVRVGGAINKGGGLNVTAGGLAIVDLNFTYFWPLDQEMFVGVRSGLNLGYASYVYEKALMMEQYSNMDYLGHQMDYTITASQVQQRVKQMNFEIPMMAAFRYYNLNIGAGFKILTPSLSNSYTQNINEIHINAYYPEYGVTVRDEMITGELNNGLMTNGKNAVSAFNFLYSMDVAYEWHIDENRTIGLGAFLDASLGGTSAAERGSRGRMIDVDPIQYADYPVPDVNIYALSMYAKTTHYIAFGAKFYFAFDAEDYNAKGLYGRLRRKGSMGRMRHIGRTGVRYRRR